MSISQHIMVGVVAVGLTALLGATASNDLAPAQGSEQTDNAFWLKTKLSDELLSSRLNVTTVAKTAGRMTIPARSPRKRKRTAQLSR